MAAVFGVGEKAYIVESNRFIREVKILKFGGGFYTVRFADRDGGTRVRESRLFKTKEDAEASLPIKEVKHKTPYGW